jgi:hypothetical protein
MGTDELKYENANITRRCTRTIFTLRSKIAGELGRYIAFTFGQLSLVTFAFFDLSVLL